MALTDTYDPVSSTKTVTSNQANLTKPQLSNEHTKPSLVSAY